MDGAQLVVPMQPRGRPSLSWSWLLVAVAWGLVGLAVLTQHAYILDHHQLMEGHIMSMDGHYMRMGGLHLPSIAALGLFLAAWQVMTVAMMLPSSLPTLARFAQATRPRHRPQVALGVLLAGYAAVWTAFGLATFLDALLLMRLEDAWPWLADRPWVIGAALPAVAGAYEFSASKARHLTASYGPAQGPGRYEESGPCATWRGGLRHGIHCVGSCGALIWMMCAGGSTTVPRMAVLTVVMAVEKRAPCSRRLTRGVGIALLLLAAVRVAYPLSLEDLVPADAAL